jgi:hypothetical protein
MRVSSFPAIVITLALVLACSACSKAPAPRAQTDAERAVADFKAAGEQLERAFAQLSKVSRPVTDADALAQQLRIDPARARAIAGTTGAPVFTVDGTSAMIVCSGNTCTCHGAAECTYVFAQICKDASLPASCNDAPDDVRVCTCAWTSR